MKKPASVVKKSFHRGIFGILGGLLGGAFGGMVTPGIASALELDWSGQFWSEYNFIHNYSMDSTNATADSTRNAAGGYYVPGGGTKDASFQSLFLRLRPKLVVNDNIYIKSELWFGDPIYGMFGNAVPSGNDQRQYYSSQSRGSSISAQRFWGEFLTDLGTVQVGRVPLNWGLGIVWESGDDVWDRYMSTGDAIRWIAKFGSFSFIPSVILSSTGNTVGGACLVAGGPTVCTPSTGTGGVVDYSLIFKYENTDDEFEAGVNLMKRLAGASQDPSSGLLIPGVAANTVGGANLLTYDFYAKKKFDKLVLTAEVPLVSGTLGGSQVNSLALATEADWKPSDTIEFILKAGYAPGEASSDAATLGNYNAFYFNPNYHLGMIMFNYQLANLGQVQTLNSSKVASNQLSSPYDNPIVNAAYLALTVPIKPWDKWTLKPGLAYASALQTASASSASFFNYWQRTSQVNKLKSDQGSSLGIEADLGITFQWDDYFQFSWDNGIYFPGSFYAFSNTAKANATDPVFATSVRIGVNF